MGEKAKTTTSSPPPPAAPPVDFEQSLNELERLVERMEQGELPLEEALRQFERGVELTRLCQNALTAAEQRVEQLLAQNGQPQIVPFDAPEVARDD